MHFEYVIVVQQTSAEVAAEARAQARAEARAQAAEVRARAQEDAQRIREEAQRVREEAQRIREEVQEELRAQQEHPEGRGGLLVHVPPTPPWERNDIPPHVVDVITLFVVGMVICIVGLPIARALGRWIDRRGLPSPVSAELAAQMNRIEQAVDSMSVEVERISEAQRFQAKLLAENVRA